MLWSLKPETFLDYKDFLMWCSESTSTYSNLPEGYFNVISKQSWTHLLMQIVKVYSIVLVYVFMHVLYIQVLVLPTVESSINKTIKQHYKLIFYGHETRMDPLQSVQMLWCT